VSLLSFQLLFQTSLKEKNANLFHTLHPPTSKSCTFLPKQMQIPALTMHAGNWHAKKQIC